ncbi:MAG: type II toxin-antitoxin system RelE/ParE family toxin [Nitrospirae bacterium]|nr:type II toxin-antitoxin system RelE/ParE family toxin [Magnetococcales bacterium]HAT51534.1 type II toxin-antitoxin system RelE/ParE family toxin [Alphaproteobacteria bacterium]
MKVRFTPSGLAEHLKALEFLQEENPTAAWRYIEHLDNLLKQLEQFPKSGRPLPEYPDLSYREVIVRPNRYIYHVSGETVWIATVWGERRGKKKLQPPT